MKYCGVILAGGKSLRMGQTKSLLPLRDEPVVSHIVREIKKCVDEVVIVANDPSAYIFLQVPIVKDRYTGAGPLAGMEAAFHRDADVFVVSACDTPFINHQVYMQLMGCLKGNDAVIPEYGERIHPLAGIYKKSVLPVVQQQLENNVRKVDRMFDFLQVAYVNDFGIISDDILEKHFFNMNHPAQYDWAKQV